MSSFVESMPIEYNYQKEKDLRNWFLTNRKLDIKLVERKQPIIVFDLEMALEEIEKEII